MADGTTGPTQFATDEVRVDIRGDVLVITLDRPRSRNAVTRAMACTIEQVIDAFETSDLRVAVITGAAGTFSSGADMADLARGETAHAPRRGFAGFVQQPPTKPLIAAVEGYAVGGGFEIAIACDLVVASATAQFGLPEVRHGICAGSGGLVDLPRQIPVHIALEVVLTGELVSSARARELGFVNRVVAEGQALDEAVCLAATIARNAPLAVIASKRVVTESVGWAPKDRWNRQAEVLDPVHASADADEGTRAFLEKRPPAWRNR